MPRLSKIVVGRISESRPLKKPSPRRPKLPSTFRLRSKKWMFAFFGAINPLSRQRNAARRRFSNGIYPSLLNVLRTPRPQTSLKKIIRAISAIEETVVIVTLTAQDFPALHQPLGSIQLPLLIKTTKTATGHQSGRTGS